MGPTSGQLHPAPGQQEPHMPSVGTDKVAVVMVPLPAQGHLNQLLHLSRLISTYGIPVHYVTTSSHIHQAKLRYIQGWLPGDIHFHGFDIPPFPSPSPDPYASSKFPSQFLPAFEAAASHLCHHVSALVRSLATASGHHRVVVIHDSLMASVIQDAALLSNVETYIFNSSSAFSLYSYKAKDTAVQLPPGEGEDGTSSLGNTQWPAFPAEFLTFVEYQLKFWSPSSGCLYNTTRAVEGVFMDFMAKLESDRTHWAVGPFNPVTIPSSTSASDGRRSEGSNGKCIKWLNHQPSNSVIYVSFGTTVALNKEQVHEIAGGLEDSRLRFIWVLREADKGENFNNAGDSSVETPELVELSLPAGFEERTGGLGLVVREWAPQLEILGHPAVGGFMSHCGWNSCIESISMGVPMAAWPMHSDQPSNSTLVTRILKIGVMVEELSNLATGAPVKSPSIEKAVRILMCSEEGDHMRKRAAELSEAVRRSVDEGGVSRAELESFIAHITRS